MASALQAEIQRSVILLAVIVFFFYCAAVMFTALAPITYVQITGAHYLIGLPPAIFLLSNMIAAYPAGMAMDRYGRIRVISAGLLLGSVGNFLTAISITQSSIWLFFLGIVLVGFSSASVILIRLAASDLFLPGKQGRGLGVILIGAVFGGTVGPLIFSILFSQLSHNKNMLTAFWMMGGVIMGCGYLTTLLLKKDTKVLAKALSEQAAVITPQAGKITVNSVSRFQVFSVLTIGAMGHAFMVALMSLSGYMMKSHGHSMESLFFMVGIHFVGMFGFSALVGRFVDKFGYVTSISLGYCLIAAATAVLPFSTEMSTFMVSMFLLGLGWNFTFIAATVRLTSFVEPQSRGKYLGMQDLVAGLLGGTFSLSAGYLLSISRGDAIAIAGISIIALVMIFVLLSARNNPVTPSMST